MTKKLHLKCLYICLFFLNSLLSSAQVGIGTTIPNGALDITSTTDGLLIPRVALTITTSALPLTTPTISEIVYNTATVADVTPGYYYWNGTIWVRLLTSVPAGWNTTGNTGTSATTNFVGTTDAVDFVTRTNNTEKMRVTSAGNVGIGSTTPTSLLEVGSATSNASAAITTKTATSVSAFTPATFADYNGGVIQSTYPGGATGQVLNIAATGSNSGNWPSHISLHTRNNLGTNATEKVRITAAGNVGIGTTTPAAKLDVATGTTTNQTAVNATGSINDFLQFNIQNTSTGTQAQSGYSATADNGTSTTGFAWMGINNSTFNYPTAYNIGAANDVTYVGSGQDMYVANANNTKSIIFSTGTATTPFFSERMRITNAGNVGINTPSPTNKLHITTGTAGSSGLRFTNLTSTNFLATNASGDVVSATTGATNGAFWGLTGNTGTSAATNFVGTTDAVDFITRTNNTEKMRVTSAGNVGIGSTTPLGRFQVNNASDINGITVRGSADWDALSIAHDGNIAYMSAAGANAISFRTNTINTGDYLTAAYTEQMRITNTGNVGIGTTAPAAKLDVAAGTTTNQTGVNLTGSINDFLQFNVQNTSTGTQAQSGYSATADNGTATTGFAWMGINNSTFNFPTAYNIGAANDVTYVGSGQDMYIANANNTKSIIFSTGKATTPFFTERARILNNGRFLINESASTDPTNLFEAKTTSTTNDTAIGAFSYGTGSTIYGENYSTLAGTNIGVTGANTGASVTTGVGMFAYLGSNTTAAATGSLAALQAQSYSRSSNTINAFNNGGGNGIYGFTYGYTNPSAAYGVFGRVLQTTSGGNQDVAGVAGLHTNIRQGTGAYLGPFVGSANSALAGVAGAFSSRETVNTVDGYFFGMIGDVLIDSSVGGATIPRRTGGVLAQNSSTWTSLAYINSGGTMYGTYSSTATNGNGAGRMNTEDAPSAVVGIGVEGGFMGGFVKGSQYGLIAKGKQMGAYVDGNTVTNKPYIQLIEGNDQRNVTYVSTSTSIDITTRGKGKLTNGETFIAFDQKFLNSVDSNILTTSDQANETVNITITPIGDCNGVFVKEVTATGFYVKEMRNGNSNVSFNWTAIGTQKNAKEVALDETILSKDFDQNLGEVMHNENDTTSKAKPIYFDGSKIKFDEIPEHIKGKARSIGKQPEINEVKLKETK